MAKQKQPTQPQKTTFFCPDCEGKKIYILSILDGRSLNLLCASCFTELFINLDKPSEVLEKIKKEASYLG